jgi:hypothetical protein
MRLRLGAALLALVHITCQGVPLTAPPGSTLELIANPTFIPAHGGVSRIVAIVTEPAGTPVVDGTVVLFFTDLGRIDDRARTTDGIAQVNLVADSRSGTAHVQAFSGGPSSGASTPSPSPSTTSVPGGVSVFGSAAGGSIATVANSDTVDVVIGNANVEVIQIRAEPTRIGSSRTTTVIATVYDANGNPIPNVPVFFKVSTPQGTESFDNPGPVFTNNNGEAASTLRTRRDTAGGTVTVYAEAPGVGGLVQSDDYVIPVF